MSKKLESPKLADVLLRIDELFEQKLQSKTGWGRNEVLTQYRNAAREAILELLG